MEKLIVNCQIIESNEVEQDIIIPLELLGENLFSDQMVSLFRLLKPWERRHNHEGDLYFSFSTYGIELLFDSKWILTTIYYNIFNKKYSRITYCNQILKNLTSGTRPIDIKKQLSRPYLSVRGDYNIDKWKFDQHTICAAYNSEISSIKLIVGELYEANLFPCPPPGYPVFR